MKEPKIIYYKDELNDEFSKAKIKPRVIDENYIYIHKNPLWNIASFLVQNVFSVPIKVLYSKFKFRIKYVGKEKLKKYNKVDEIGDLLSEFDAISVRDTNSGNIVEKLTEKEVRFNLDPVLTYDYMNCCDKIPQIESKEKYMILYAYAGRISNEEAAWIKKYAKSKGLKIYAIGGVQPGADEFVDCSPFEVLAYFKNAQEVITDTFHGSIFSVITHRPFTTLVRKSVENNYGNEEKLTDLLTRLGLTDRMTYEVEESEKINKCEIDYKKVDDILSQQRECACKYLKENI